VKLNLLALKDKNLFCDFLNRKSHELSVYVFENVYIWKGLFDIKWAIIEDGLCIFFQDKIGVFLYLPPLGKNPGAAGKAFRIMDKFNKNKEISRIENVEEKDLDFYKGLDYNCSIKANEYLCESSDLAGLRGNRFKSKRASLNYFTKHNQCEYLPFNLQYRNHCLKLYDYWMSERRQKSSEYLYRCLLSDSKSCLKILLKDYKRLDLTGRVVRINNEIKAFTFGYKLNQDTFCILYEVADLSFKGIAQFIFKKFCEELSGYKYINVMDDSGLENLKKVKLSYRPIREVPAYIVKRKNGLKAC
jgi:uncharacterized protein